MKFQDPRALDANCITFGNARFTVITANLLRLEYACDACFEDRASLMVSNRRSPAVQHLVSINGNILSINTEGIRLEFRDDGNVFSAQNLRISFVSNNTTKTWRPGQKDRGNLGGTLRTLDGMKGVWKTEGSPRVLKEKAVLPPGLLSKNGWALVDDSSGIVLNSHDKGRPWVASRNPGVRRDWYFLAHGRDYTRALAEAQIVFGQQPLPPRFSLGYWWSRYWAYTDIELKDLVSTFDRMGIPLDVLVLDMDWHKLGWTGYTWDQNFFPDPKGFMAWVKAQGLKLTLNLHPANGVGDHEEQFGAMARALKVDPKQRNIPFDCVDPIFMDAYFKHLHHTHEDDRVDFWWMDWQQGRTCKLEGLDPLPWLNRLHWDDMEHRDPGKRPLIFSRFGGIGSGRNPIGFSGDTFICWESLAYQPWFTATAANALYGYWSHDIGGHFEGTLNGELYSRWLQFGAYSPVLRTHAAKIPGNDRRFWLFGEPYASLMAETIRKRYELVPYIYTENRKAMDSGISLCHPLYYRHPDEPAAYLAKNQYYFGEKMIVAPIVSPVDKSDDQAACSLWLPEGSWIDTAVGAPISGGKQRRRYAIWDTPVFVAPGTVICGQPVVNRLLPGSYEMLVATVYPGSRGVYTLYEDDGVSQGYRQGACAHITIESSGSKYTRTIDVKPAQGRFKGFLPKRDLEIRLAFSIPPRKVVAGGKSLAWQMEPATNGWWYDGDNATVVIRVAGINITRGISVRVEYDPKIDQRLAEGIKGMIIRAKAAMELAHGVYEFTHDREIARFAQLGNRLAIDPSSFVVEVGDLKGQLRVLERICRSVVKQFQANPKHNKDHAIIGQKIASIVKTARNCLR